MVITIEDFVREVPGQIEGVWLSMKLFSGRRELIRGWLSHHHYFFPFGLSVDPFRTGSFSRWLTRSGSNSLRLLYFFPSARFPLAGVRETQISSHGRTTWPTIRLGRKPIRTVFKLMHFLHIRTKRSAIFIEEVIGDLMSRFCKILNGQQVLSFRSFFCHWNSSWPAVPVNKQQSFGYLKNPRKNFKP